MTTELSYNAEEYVEAIYKLQKRSGVAKTKELAEELDVVPGSITNTIEHLEKHDLVEHEPYKGVKLTAKGEALALYIIRRHRLAERLLTDILNAEWSDVHENACKLEHALTEDVIALLEKKLEYPKVCPHGNPIPNEHGEIEEQECYPLTEVRLNELCKVAKISNENREKLQLLANNGIKPDAKIHIAKRRGTRIILCVDGRERSLNCNDVSSVWVKPLEAKK